MSAINDALRRASSAAKSNPTPSPLPPMPVTEPPPVPGNSEVEPAPPAPEPLGMENAKPPIIPPGFVPPALPQAKRSKVPGLIMGAFVLLLVGLAGALWARNGFVVFAKDSPAFFSKYAGEHDDEIDTAESEVEADRNVGARASSPVPTESPVTPATISPPSVNAPASVAPAAVPAVVARPMTPVKFPPMRLQSVFYRVGNPSVMINGKTLYIGDDIQGVAVVDIQPSSVTLVLSGQTNVLTLR